MERERINCLVDVLLFLRRICPFPSALNRHIKRITQCQLFEKKNEDLMLELTHYLYSNLNPELCHKHIKWPRVNPKQFFQDVQAFFAAVTKEPNMKRLPKPKSSSLCFPGTSRDYEYQLSFIFQTTEVVLGAMIEKAYHGDRALKSSRSNSLEQQKTDEAQAIRQLVVNYHRYRATVERNEKLNEIKQKANHILDSFVQLSIPEGDQSKIRNNPRAIKKYFSPVIRRNDVLIRMKHVMTNIQQEVDEINYRKFDAKSISLIEQFAEQNNVNLRDDGKISLTAFVQMYQLYLNKRVEFISLCTKSPLFESLKRQKNDLSLAVESMETMLVSVRETVDDKERSVRLLRDKCSLLRLELGELTHSTNFYRPSFSLQDSVRFSDSVINFSPVTGSVESRKSIVENVKKNEEARRATRFSHSSFTDSPHGLARANRWSFVNGSPLSEPPSGFLNDPLSTSSPLSNNNRDDVNESTTAPFQGDAFSLIDDTLPELQLPSFQISSTSDNGQNDTTEGDEFETPVCVSSVPQVELVISRYLEFQRRLKDSL